MRISTLVIYIIIYMILNMNSREYSYDFLVDTGVVTIILPFLMAYMKKKYGYYFKVNTMENKRNIYYIVVLILCFLNLLSNLFYDDILIICIGAWSVLSTLIVLYLIKKDGFIIDLNQYNAASLTILKGTTLIVIFLIITTWDMISHMGVNLYPILTIFAGFLAYPMICIIPLNNILLILFIFNMFKIHAKNIAVNGFAPYNSSSSEKDKLETLSKFTIADFMSSKFTKLLFINEISFIKYIELPLYENKLLCFILRGGYGVLFGKVVNVDGELFTRLFNLNNRMMNEIPCVLTEDVVEENISAIFEADMIYQHYYNQGE